jgi:hypothetical protein
MKNFFQLLVRTVSIILFLSASFETTTTKKTTKATTKLTTKLTTLKSTTTAVTCANGGIRNSLLNTCTCPSCYSDPICSTVDTCCTDQTTCQNGGSSFSNGGSYATCLCMCTAEYTGNFCETSLTTTAITTAKQTTTSYLESLTSRGNKLPSSSTLKSNEKLVSSNGYNSAFFQSGTFWIWASAGYWYYVPGTGIISAVMQANGNLQFLDASSNVIYETKTYVPGSYLRM